ncbi:MAG: xanthine dehydrogenase accessory protein XdhC [Pseudomonadota bacterium]
MRDAGPADLLGPFPLVVAHIDVARGSAPRAAGTFMVILAGGTVGTIGGGSVEHAVIAAARAVTGVRTLDFSLGPGLDQCCGGHMTVTLARLEAPPPAGHLWPGGPALATRRETPVFVFGAGHVGLALCEALAPLPFDVTLIDGRPGDGPGQRLAIPEAAVAEAPADALFVVMTHSHALDLEIVAAALSRRARFVGLIGSATKRAIFLRRLKERGVDASRLTCPIGLPGISGKAPAVIAASVAAQLLLVAPG